MFVFLIASQKTFQLRIFKHKTVPKMNQNLKHSLYFHVDKTIQVLQKN